MQHSSFPSPALITKWYCGDYFILPMHLIGQTFWHLLGSSLAFLCLMETWEGVFNHEEYQNGETVLLTFCLHVLMQDKMSLLFSLALPRSSMSNEILDDLLALMLTKWMWKISMLTTAFNRGGKQKPDAQISNRGKCTKRNRESMILIPVVIRTLIPVTISTYQSYTYWWPQCWTASYDKVN